jgi:hypothetical protein
VARTPAGFVVDDLEDAPDTIRFLLEANASAAGALTLLVDPTSRGYSALEPLVAWTLGRNDPWGARARLETAAWVRASGVREIVVARAHLATPAFWERACALAARCEATIWLLCQGVVTSRAQRAVAGAHGLATSELATLRRRIEALERTREPKARRDAFPRVPRASFLHFLAEARDSLGTDEFALVEHVYDEAFMEAARLASLPAVDVAQTARLVRRLLASSASREEALTRLVACQAAYFSVGLSLRAEPARVLANVEAQPALAQALAAIEREPRPSYAALAALILDGGLSSAELVGLRMDGVCDEGRTVSLDRGVVALRHGHARLAVRAQRELRTMLGAGPKAHLFARMRGSVASPYTIEGLERELRRIGGRMGIDLCGPASRRRESDVAWALRCRLSLDELGPARRSGAPNGELRRAA